MYTTQLFLFSFHSGASLCCINFAMVLVHLYANLLTCLNHLLLKMYNSYVINMLQSDLGLYRLRICFDSVSTLSMPHYHCTC